MDEEEKMKKKIDIARRKMVLQEKSIQRVLDVLDHAPKDVLEKMAEPLALSWESGKENVNNIDTFTSPVREIALSNFMFGKTFGKTELLLQLVERRLEKG